MPPAHPFNPLQVLRTSVALESSGAAINTIFDFIYAEGGDVTDELGWCELTARLGIAPDDDRISAPKTKRRLKENTNNAVTAGVFGVPTFIANAELFWGNDAMDMFLDWLDDPNRFSTGEFARFQNLPIGARRRELE